MNKEHKKMIVLVGATFLFGIIIGVGSVAASYGNTSGFWNNIMRPWSSSFTESTASSTPSISKTSLYKPAASYEDAVIGAVKKATPEVVSIVISKDVPVITQCSTNPFSNLPPQFKQFFGNEGGFTQRCATGKTHLQRVGGGSGFIVSSDGLILTNKHVVSDTNASYTVITNSGKKYKAKVLARDPNQDLAIVKINATGLPTLSLGDSSGLELGQTAIAIGNALGRFSNTVSVGVVSGLARTVTAGDPFSGSRETISGVIQTDAAINPGNSGGPLLNLRGQVIGINTAVATNAHGIGFAIPINRAKHDIASVKATGQIQSPFLGVRYIMITNKLATSQKLSVDSGALIRGDSKGPAVEPDSPASHAGIRAEDIITSINGKSINTNNPLGTAIEEYNVGKNITLGINRDGKHIILHATLEKRPSGL